MKFCEVGTNEWSLGTPVPKQGPQTSAWFACPDGAAQCKGMMGRFYHLWDPSVNNYYYIIVMFPLLLPTHKTGAYADFHFRLLKIDSSAGKEEQRNTKQIPGQRWTGTKVHN